MMLHRFPTVDEWRRWFAWRPVIADMRDGTDAIVWVRWVEWQVNGLPCLTHDYRVPKDAP